MTWVAALVAGLAVLCWVPGEVRPGRPRARSGTGLRPIAAVGVGVGAWLFVGGTLAPVAALVAAAGAWSLLTRVEAPSLRREREEVQRTLPHLIDLFASTLRAGAEPTAGLAQVCGALPGPAAQRLMPVVERARWGGSASDAWQSILDDEVLAPLGRAMVRSLTSGASVVQTVERLADDLARESSARAEDAARRVGVSAAIPLGVCLLPAFLLVGVVPTAASLLGAVAP